MQEELIEMLDKMVKYFDEIPSDSYYYRETASILNEAEKLVEKAKNGAKEPAVPQGWKLVPVEPTSEMLSAVGKEMSWCNPVGIFRKMLAATPAAPSQERCCTCGYLTSEREHLGCLRKAVKDLDAATGGPYPSQPVTLTDERLREIDDAHNWQTTEGRMAAYRAIIAALREKEQAK